MTHPPDPLTSRERARDEEILRHLEYDRARLANNPHRLASVIWGIVFAALPVFVIAGLILKYAGIAK